MASTIKRTSEFPMERDVSLANLKDHIVQIEAMIAFGIFCLFGLFFVNIALVEKALGVFCWLLPSVLLMLMRQVVRVTNPKSATRNVLVWATTLGGAGGVIVGGTCDILSGGLTGGQGALLGYGGGAALGAAIGNWIEGLGSGSVGFLTREQAYDLLLLRFGSNEDINQILDHRIPWHDRSGNGSRWYLQRDLDNFAAEK